MKKMIFALMLFVFSFFTVSGVSAASSSSAVTAKSKIAKPKFSGHWEYWCIYNEKTGEFEIWAVWVEDDM